MRKDSVRIEFSDNIEDAIDIMGSMFKGVTDGDMEKIKNQKTFPLIALKSSVFFPSIIMPVALSREKTKITVDAIEKSNDFALIVAQQPETEGFDNTYKIGTIARVIKRFEMPDGQDTAIFQGIARAKISRFQVKNPFPRVKLELLSDDTGDVGSKEDVLKKMLHDQMEKILKMQHEFGMLPGGPDDFQNPLSVFKDISDISYNALNFLNTPVVDKQMVLEELNVEQRCEHVIEFMDREIQFLQIKQNIHNKVQQDLSKQQRDYFLNQQMKQIQDELGGDPLQQDIQEYIERSEQKKWGKEIQSVFEKELERLKRANPSSPDYSVQVNYIETLLDVPFNEYSDDKIDIKQAGKLLDEEHFGLEKPKKRILEYLSVLKLKGDLKSPILCLVGPPGVGKTSLAASIAKAIGRKYTRMSLGGVHDESEIRGHRKTYIGSMPGRIIQNLKKVGVSNPVFVLDEIDKLGRDHKGDPSSALLEVLDPEQNDSFQDNFLDVEFDLSKVMFLATANSLDGIPRPLLDRMEIIHVEGYSAEEKIEIAKLHLIQKLLDDHGVQKSQIKLSKEVLSLVVHNYTKESGVRELNRKLAGIMRYAATQIASGETEKVVISKKNLEEVLGKHIYRNSDFDNEDKIGVTTALAYTIFGGEAMFIETNLSKGKGKLTLTGSLGDVMKESATAALSYLKANADDLGINNKKFEEYDIHIHVPEGATKKDGPSAGVTMYTSLLSLFTGKKVKGDLAMTGEITLRGKVLPIGGVKEKVLAAKRYGKNTVLLPKANERDFEELNEKYIEGMHISFVETAKDVAKHALV